MWGIYQKYIPPNTNSKERMHPHIYISDIYGNQDLEIAWVPISRWMDQNKTKQKNNHHHHHQKTCDAFIF